MEFARRLKEIRISKGLNQREFSILIGITESSISQYERGGRSPCAEILVKISKKLNITTDYLLGLEKKEIDIFENIKEYDKNILMKFIDCLRK